MFRLSRCSGYILFVQSIHNNRLNELIRNIPLHTNFVDKYHQIHKLYNTFFHYIYQIKIHVVESKHFYRFSHPINILTSFVNINSCWRGRCTCITINCTIMLKITHLPSNFSSNWWQVEKYGPYPAGKHRKSTERGCSIPVNESSDRICPVSPGTGRIRSPDSFVEFLAFFGGFRAKTVCFLRVSAGKFMEYCVKNHRPGCQKWCFHK
jgi:hypothetical protein